MAARIGVMSATIETMRSQYTDLLYQLEQAEADLAALRARRCDECAMWKWRSCPVSFFGLFEYHDLADDERGTGGGSDYPAPDFSCNRWAERKEQAADGCG